MKDRIREIMEGRGMSQLAFSSFVGIAPATLSSIFNGRTKPTINIVEAIKKSIPEISTDWLLFGSGSMYEEASRGQRDGESSGVTYTEEGGQQLISFPDYPNETASGGSGRSETGVASSHISPKREVKNAEETIKTEVKYIDKPQRKIVEIKVYFDDYTYESFVPSDKK